MKPFAYRNLRLTFLFVSVLLVVFGFALFISIKFLVPYESANWGPDLHGFYDERNLRLAAAFFSFKAGIFFAATSGLVKLIENKNVGKFK
jgi:hypothetical protein